ncbi:MAG: hypothetical protein VB878_22930 [Pirellulaceae bacterium]|jgi:hypothetical protein
MKAIAVFDPAHKRCADLRGFVPSYELFIFSHEDTKPQRRQVKKGQEKGGIAPDSKRDSKDWLTNYGTNVQYLTGEDDNLSKGAYGNAFSGERLRSMTHPTGL